MELPTFQDILQAAAVVKQHLQPTLCYDWPLLAERLNCRCFVKHENHQPTGAFKVRGGVNLVSRLQDEERRRGIIGCSTGNHGQSLAYAARLFGVRCVIVVPEGNNPDKSASIRALGAELVEAGRDFDEAKLACELLAQQQGFRYVHSANEPHLIAGVGTIALEIFQTVPNLDVLFVPIGLGSSVCGNLLVAHELSPQTRVIGVQAVGAAAVADSWRTKQWVEYDKVSTFAEGLATRKPAEMTLNIMRELLHEMVLVDDAQIRQAMRLLLETTHNLSEPAGAAALAAAWQMKDELSNKRIAVLLSGGNCDLRILPQLC